jgi:hypothetical protein
VRLAAATPTIFPPFLLRLVPTTTNTFDVLQRNLAVALVGVLLIGPHAMEGVKNTIQDHIHNPKTETLTISPPNRVQIEPFKHIHS